MADQDIPLFDATAFSPIMNTYDGQPETPSKTDSLLSLTKYNPNSSNDILKLQTP